MRPRLLSLSAAMLALTTVAQAYDFRMGASATYAENFSRTSYTPTAKDAAVVTVDGALNHAWQLAPNWSLIASAEGGVEHVDRFSAMNRASAGLRATFRHKFGLGPDVPVLEFGGALTAVSFREDGRSGWRQEGFARLGKRLTDIWRVAATADWESFTAAHAPFDTHARRLGVETFVDLTERWQFGLGTARLHGQLVANAAWEIWRQAIGGGLGPTVQGYYTRIPWETSDTFGPGWVAYRIDARADFWWTEFSFALSDHTRIPLRLDKVKVINQIGIRYETRLWSLGVLHRF